MIGKLGLTCACIAALGGCATQPDKIASQSVSPLTYEKYDCEQLALERDRVGKRIGTLYASLRKTASNDQGQMAVGLLLFWPALFFLEGGDGPEAAEYGRLKGEFEAIDAAAVGKKCDFRQAKTLEEYTPKKEMDAASRSYQ